MMNEEGDGMKDFETGMECMKQALTELGKAAIEVGLLSDCLSDVEFQRMKNCVNCNHYEVCVVVHDRKRRQAGDYSPCGKWKLVEK